MKATARATTKATKVSDSAAAVDVMVGPSDGVTGYKRCDVSIHRTSSAGSTSMSRCRLPSRARSAISSPPWASRGAGDASPSDVLWHPPSTIRDEAEASYDDGDRDEDDST